MTLFEVEDRLHHDVWCRLAQLVSCGKMSGWTVVYCSLSLVMAQLCAYVYYYISFTGQLVVIISKSRGKKCIKLSKIQPKTKSLGVDSDYELNQKLVRFALGRGFTFDIIRQCIQVDEEMEFTDETD